jgi:type I restriction enzyme M protein
VFARILITTPKQGNHHRVAPTEYRDIPGFCKSVTIEDIRKHGYVLTPGRYVGAAPQEKDDEPFEEKMARLVAQLREQQAAARRLDAEIARNLQELGFWENSR